MGTIADKLNNILNSKNAIKSKFNLPDSLPFIQYADNIQAGGSSTMNFYKCAAIGQWFPEPVFYAPLSADSGSAETGQTLSKYGSVLFTEGRSGLRSFSAWRNL